MGIWPPPPPEPWAASGFVATVDLPPHAGASVPTAMTSDRAIGIRILILRAVRAYLCGGRATPTTRAETARPSGCLSLSRDVTTTIGSYGARKVGEPASATRAGVDYAWGSRRTRALDESLLEESVRSALWHRPAARAALLRVRAHPGGAKQRRQESGRSGVFLVQRMCIGYVQQQLPVRTAGGYPLPRSGRNLWADQTRGLLRQLAGHRWDVLSELRWHRPHRHELPRDGG